MTEPTVLVETYGVYSVVLGDEAEMVLSSGDWDDVAEIVDDARSVVIRIDSSTPTVSGFSPSKKLSWTEGSLD